jgi:hypothetical protein
VREEKAAEAQIRPVITKFVQGERLRIDETRFDEFKAIVGPDPVKAVLNELDGYVLDTQCSGGGAIKVLSSPLKCLLVRPELGLDHFDLLLSRPSTTIWVEQSGSISDDL